MQQQHFKIGSNHHFLIKKHFYFGKNRSVYRLLEAHLYRLLANFSLFRPFTATSHLATTASERLCTKAFQEMCGSVAANLKFFLYVVISLVDGGRNLNKKARFRPPSFYLPTKRSSRTTSCWTFPLYWFLFTPNVVIIVGTNDFFVLVAALNAAILFRSRSE